MQPFLFERRSVGPDADECDEAGGYRETAREHYPSRPDRCLAEEHRVPREGVRTVLEKVIRGDLGLKPPAVGYRAIVARDCRRDEAAACCDRYRAKEIGRAGSSVSPAMPRAQPGQRDGHACEDG